MSHPIISGEWAVSALKKWIFRNFARPLLGGSSAPGPKRALVNWLPKGRRNDAPRWSCEVGAPGGSSAYPWLGLRRCFKTIGGKPEVLGLPAGLQYLKVPPGNLSMLTIQVRKKPRLHPDLSRQRNWINFHLSGFPFSPHHSLCEICLS